MQARKNLCKMIAMGLSLLSPMLASSAQTFAASPDIHVDQVGYITNLDKVAMVTLPAVGDAFTLVDTKTGAAVYTGQLSQPVYDKSSGENVRQADFTAFQTPGTYKLMVGAEDSYAFTIGDNVYAVPALQNWRSYTLSRSNTPFHDELTGLTVKQGHAQDKAAQVYFTDKLNKKGDVLDVSGGWYDAGDYGKYTTTAAIAAAEMMLAYEAKPEHFFQGQLFFPEGVKGENMPDALSEVKFELEFMKKLERKDGSTFHKVAGAQWPGFDKSPDTDLQPRFIYGNCSASTAMYGAAMALAGRTYAAYDRDFAADCLQRAQKVWKYLEKQKDSLYRMDDGQESGSGPYDDRNDLTERLWLAAELFKTTGDTKYEKYLQQQAKTMTKKPGFFTWDDTLALAQFSYGTAPKADADFQQQVQQGLVSYADEIMSQIEADQYRCSLQKNEYTWASTKNNLTKGDILLMAYQIKPEAGYLRGAMDQIHYLFGRNAMNKSYMTGVGANPPEHPHNRIHESTGAYVPGLIVGGPNCVPGGDPDQTAYLAAENPAPAKCYLDVLTSWSTNEYAIDYGGAGIYALSWFMEPDRTLQAKDLKLMRVFPTVK